MQSERRWVFGHVLMLVFRLVAFLVLTFTAWIYVSPAFAAPTDLLVICVAPSDLPSGSPQDDCTDNSGRKTVADLLPADLVKAYQADLSGWKFIAAADLVATDTYWSYDEGLEKSWADSGYTGTGEPPDDDDGEETPTSIEIRGLPVLSLAEALQIARAALLLWALAWVCRQLMSQTKGLF